MRLHLIVPVLFAMCGLLANCASANGKASDWQLVNVSDNGEYGFYIHHSLVPPNSEMISRGVVARIPADDTSEFTIVDETSGSVLFAAFSDSTTVVYFRFGLDHVSLVARRFLHPIDEHVLVQWRKGDSVNSWMRTLSAFDICPRGDLIAYTDVDGMSVRRFLDHGRSDELVSEAEGASPWFASSRRQVVYFRLHDRDPSNIGAIECFDLDEGRVTFVYKLDTGLVHAVRFPSRPKHRGCDSSVYFVGADLLDNHNLWVCDVTGRLRQVTSYVHPWRVHDFWIVDGEAVCLVFDSSSFGTEDFRDRVDRVTLPPDAF